jgi:hypothetical protein
MFITVDENNLERLAHRLRAVAEREALAQEHFCVSPEDPSAELSWRLEDTRLRTAVETVRLLGFAVQLGVDNHGAPVVTILRDGYTVVKAEAE